MLGFGRKNNHELPIPPAAAGASKPIEVARIWVANGAQHVSLRAGAWEDPAAWGLVLVDLAKHVANAYAQSGNATHAAVLARIREGFDAEWSSSTDDPTGRVEGAGRS
jgi:hypothetical protein